MKEIKTSKGTFLLVEVPNDAYEFKDTLANGVMYKLPNGEQDSIYFDEVNENLRYQIISTTKEITKEQTESIVDNTSKESLNSLIQANDLDLNNNYLIIQIL